MKVKFIVTFGELLFLREVLLSEFCGMTLCFHSNRLSN